MDARIEITTQRAEIEVRSRKARVEISTNRPRFEMHRNLPRMQMDRRLPTLRVDRSAVDAALGVGPVLEAASQFYREAYQKGIQAIGKIAAEGTAMMHLENGGNVIVELAKQSMLEDEVDVNTASLPQPDIYWDPGYISINWTDASFQMEWDVSAWADIRVEPHVVEIRMVKYPQIHIRVIYEEDKPSGNIVDKYL